MLGSGGQPSEQQLVARLASAQASLAEPYWHRSSLARPAQQRRVAPDASEAARLKKQLAALSKDFSGLLANHERADAQLQDFQQKIRLLRQELASKDKALDLSRRTIDRLTQEKTQHEAGVAADKAYIRKLEARLLSVKDVVELQAQCSDLRLQTEHLAQQLRLAEARSATAEEAQQRQQQEAAFLKRATELAAEQLTKSVGAEVPATLLVALARAQEEGVAMSVQLADSRQQLAQMASALQHARAHLLEQQKSLEQLQGESSQAARDVAAVQQELQAERVAATELRHIVEALKQQVAGLREERDELRHHLELERTAAAAAEDKVVELDAARKQQAKVEATLRAELRQLKAQQHQEQRAASRAAAAPGPTQHQQPAAPGAKAAAPALKRPAAPTPKRSMLGGGHAEQLLREGPSPIQRLRQQREQQWGRSSPAPPAGRAVPRVPPTETLFDAQRQLAGSAARMLPGEADGWEGDDDAWLLATSGSHTAEPAGTAAGAARAAALPVRDGKLMDLYTCALDEQIDQLEGELAVLSASASPSKLQELLLAGLQRQQQQPGGQQPARGPASDPAATEAPPQSHLPRLEQRGARQQPQQQRGGGGSEAGQQQAPSRLKQPSSTAAGAVAAGPAAGPQRGTASQPASPAKASRLPSAPPHHAAGTTAAAAALHHSPKKQLSPGWALGQADPGSPGASGEGEAAYRIPAWRPNGAFEPSEPDAVVLQASMPGPPPAAAGFASVGCGPAAKVAAAAAAFCAATKPQPLDLQATAACRYGSSQAADELSSGLSPLQPGSAEAAAVQPQPPSAGAQQPRAPQGEPGREHNAHSLISPGPSEASAGRSQGLVWHSNPLANTSPAALCTSQPPPAQLAAAAEAALGAQRASQEQPSNVQQVAGAQRQQAQPTQPQQEQPTERARLLQQTPMPRPASSCSSDSQGPAGLPRQQAQAQHDFGAWCHAAEPSLTPEVPVECQQQEGGGSQQGSPPPRHPPARASSAHAQGPLGQGVAPAAGAAPSGRQPQEPRGEGAAARPAGRRRSAAAAGDESRGQHAEQDWWEEEFDSMTSQGSPSLESQQQWQPGGGGGAATAEPATRKAGARSSGSSGSAAQPHPPQQQQQQQQQQQRPGSGGVESLATLAAVQQWSLPSGASSWLNTNYEPDIESLEVNSHRKPLLGAAGAVRAQPGARGGPQGGPRGHSHRPAAAAGGAGGGGVHPGEGSAQGAGHGQATLATLFELATMDLDCL